MNEPFIVRTNYKNIIIASVVIYPFLVVQGIGIVKGINAELLIVTFLLTLFLFTIPLLLLKTKVTLAANRLIFEYLFIKKEIYLEQVKNIVLRKSFTFAQGKLAGEGAKDIIFLDEKGEEIGRLDLSNPFFYNQNDVSELIKRLQDKINQ